jgi:hypothetical protein
MNDVTRVSRTLHNAWAQVFAEDWQCAMQVCHFRITSPGMDAAGLIAAYTP